MAENTIFEDKRPIKWVTTFGDEGDFWRVGYNKGVTKIVPYLENGQGASVPWLAVYSGDVIIQRINCAAVEAIAYAEQGLPE